MRDEKKVSVNTLNYKHLINLKSKVRNRFIYGCRIMLFRNLCLIFHFFSLSLLSFFFEHHV